jgi:hypothetical protein
MAMSMQLARKEAQPPAAYTMTPNMHQRDCPARSAPIAGEPMQDTHTQLASHQHTVTIKKEV